MGLLKSYPKAIQSRCPRDSPMYSSEPGTTFFSVYRGASLSTSRRVTSGSGGSLRGNANIPSSIVRTSSNSALDRKTSQSVEANHKVERTDWLGCLPKLME